MADEASLSDDVMIAGERPAPAVRPRSAVSTGVGLAGLAGLFGWFAIARLYGMDGPHSALMSVVWAGVAMVLWSILVDKVHRNPSTGIDWNAVPRPLDVAMETARVKIFALWVTWAIIAGVYGVLRYYWVGQYAFAMKVLGVSIVPLVLLSIPYVVWLDRRLTEPRDATWHFGRWLIGADDADMPMVWRHCRAWAVKGFYCAFMLSIVPGNFSGLIERPWSEVFGNPVICAQFAIGIFYLIDVHLATVGYILTMRPLDAHIRTANPYGMAWVAALICYPPFVLMNPGGPLNYQEGSAGWDVWFAAYPMLLWAWGAMLALLTGIYAWATVAFGPRFSNLTHRGIITHGPYKYTRHPAYIAKNSFWWLSSLVILPWDGSTVTAVRNTALLAAVSGIYYWRAKTEERHLLADPDYVAYYEWAQAHALIPRFFSGLTGQPQPLIRLNPDPRVGPAT